MKQNETNKTKLHKGNQRSLWERSEVSNVPLCSFTDATFLYECSDETRNRRLMAFFNTLKQVEWIDAKSNQKQFIDLFSGELLFHRIRWTGTKQNLAYLFKMLIREKKYVRTTHSRIWTTVRSHFVQPNGQPFPADMKDQKVPGSRSQMVIQVLVDLLDPSKPL